MLKYTNYTQVNDRRYNYNEGLRAYMLSVFQNMGLALLVTALVSMIVSSSTSLMSIIFATPLRFVVMFAPIVMVLYISSRIMSLSLYNAKILFWVYSALIGISLSPIYYLYTTKSIAKVFFITASLFGVMSIYGHTTKKDLSGMRSFLMMGVIGICIASVINIFLQSTGLETLISYIGVIAFTLLTAYDTQVLKSIYYQVDSGDERNISVIGKASVYGALTLYMDFINLFIILLRLFAARKD